MRLRDCLCRRGYFDSSSIDSGMLNCTICPVGSSCDSMGTVLSSLPLQRGYYRVANWSIDLRRCPDASSKQFWVRRWGW